MSSADDYVNYSAGPWLSKITGYPDGLTLEIVGGADALHQPRSFSVPIKDQHYEVIRDNFHRHLALDCAINPLCDDAGLNGDIDSAAVSALLDPILLTSDAEFDDFYRQVKYNRRMLIAYFANEKLLNRGEISLALTSSRKTPDWTKVNK